MTVSIAYHQKQPSMKKGVTSETFSVYRNIQAATTLVT